MIIDPNGLAQTIGSAGTSQQIAGSSTDPEQRVDDGMTESLLLFRAGSPQPKAVPLSLVTRLEEIDPKAIEISNGRQMTQYRGQLMPLVPANDSVRIKDAGAQPLLIFSDQGHAMGLVVDEIVDIVEERLDIEIASVHPGVLGSAVIKGQATEVIDVAHFLPMAFDDWLHWKKGRASGPPPHVLLVDDAPFFRNMLAPVIKAAGFAVTPVASVDEALATLACGRRVDVVVTDIDMPGRDGFELASSMRDNPKTAHVPIIGLSSLVSAESIERGRRVGLHDYVAKFDRQGLVAALKEQTADLDRAA
jgi:two-component system chemotaxis sensor kinase CheA